LITQYWHHFVKFTGDIEDGLIWPQHACNAKQVRPVSKILSWMVSENKGASNKRQMLGNECSEHSGLGKILTCDDLKLKGNKHIHMYLSTFKSGCYLCNIQKFLKDHTLTSPPSPPFQNKNLNASIKNINYVCDKIQKYFSLQIRPQIHFHVRHGRCDEYIQIMLMFTCTFFHTKTKVGTLYESRFCYIKM
jgi:hypothetical protein